MTTHELAELLLKERPDDEVAIAYEGMYTTAFHLAETVVFANDPARRQRILLLEEEA